MVELHPKARKIELPAGILKGKRAPCKAKTPKPKTFYH
jgi:hypothetical protein